MAITRISRSSIDTLLKSLEEKPDEQVGLTALRGRALSRSAHNIHLATRAGIVAVPIKNIQQVSSLSNTQHDVVQLLVRNPQQIQSLLKVRPFNPFGGTGGSQSFEEESAAEIIPGNNEFTYWGVGVSTCTSTDTATTSGADGAADQTDDVNETCQADDEAG